jgi:DNA-binding CsgD family transcriptional regulator
MGAFPRDNGGVITGAVVGRDAELAAVGRLLDRLVGGGVGMLILDGEPGIGKTTVWREGVERAEARGVRMLAARTAAAEAMLSYTTLADLMAPWYETVRRVLPGPQMHALDVALLRAEAETAVDPRATGTGVVRVLADLAEGAPVVVAIDDVQWLDRATRRVLEFAARRLPGRVGVLVTRRLDGDEEQPSPLAAALPAGSVERVTVGPLGLAALFHVIRYHLGAVPSRPVLARIASASGGNPFYALEIARALAGGGWRMGEEGVVPVPAALQGLVLARVRELSGAGQRAALAIAALSRPTVPLVVAVLGSVAEAEAAILEAEEAGVLVVDGEALRLAHPLLGSAVYAAASRERRRQLHRLLADVVSDPEERARHLALSERRTNEPAAAQVEEAAGRAGRRGAPDAAAELYAAAVRLTPAADRSGYARRALREAGALLSAGDPDGARTAAEAALARANTQTSRAEAHFLLGEVAWVAAPGRPPLAHLERALVEAAEAPQLRGRIHAKLVNFSLGDQALAAEHANSALALLDEDADPALYAHTLSDKVFFDAQAGSGARPDLLARAFELEERTGAAIERNRVALIWLISMDEHEAARERHELEDEWYRDRGEEGWQAERLAQRARLELYAGDWDLAERAIEESWATLEQIGRGAGPWAAPAYIRALIDVHRGRGERPLAELPALIAESERSGSRFFAAIELMALGLAQLSIGDAEAALRSYLRMDEHFRAVGVVDPTGARTEPDQVEALLALGELARARVVLERLERRGQLIPRPWITIALPRARALILAAEGELDAALVEVADPDTVAAARLPFEHARTLLVRGRILRRAKQRRAAADTLNEALRLFERLNAPTWIEQTRAELGRIGLRPAAGNELTASELRVAELAAAGLTNREVATAAFMSPKTVEANLARVYRKLGIRSRAELGARMGERRP